MLAAPPKLPPRARYLHRPPVPPARLRCVCVVPARDEADRIVDCLEALRCQWSAAARPLHDDMAVVLVVNGTTDATAYRVAQWARPHPAHALYAVDVDFPADRAHVGSARRLGLELAAELLAATAVCPPERALLFSTDADSRLRHDAVSRGLAELDHADAFGAHIIAGEADTSVIGKLYNRYAALRGELRHRLYPEAHHRHAPHGVFGGAGFGVSLAAYRAVGGLPELPYDEDQEMRRRLRAGGRRVSYPRGVVVHTSTRTDGRTPWGMAHQLVAWSQQHALGRWPLVPGRSGLVAKYLRKARWRELYRSTARAEPFERVWRRYWLREAVQARHLNRYPLVELPRAVSELEGGRLATLEYVESVPVPARAS